MSTRLLGHALLLTLTASIPACAGNSLGALGDILGGAQPSGGAQQGQIAAEIRQVNTQQQTIEVATQDGQTGAVYFDQNTTVVYQQQQYPVTALERGDLVVLQAQQDAQGRIYVSRIDVQTSVQDRTGQTGSGALRQYTGRVAQIDVDRGYFVLQDQVGNITVTLPYNPPRATLDYFRRLRVGDTVRLEATSVGTGRVEIHRFL
jgi:hypothetical protein